MGRAVGADQAAAVEREQHRQVLDRDVVDQLVVAALQEGRVDRADRLQSLAGQTRGERDRVLLGDADVEVALGEALRELDQAGALAHRRRDRDDLRIGCSGFAQPLAEDLRVAWRAGGLLAREGAGHRVELGDAVVLDRIELGGVETLALDRDQVQQLRTPGVLQALEGGAEGVEIVAVHRAVVAEAERFEDRARLLEMRFVVVVGGRSQLVRRVDAELAQQARGMVAHRADVLGDRHVVIVVDHEQVELEVPGVVERLEGHAGGHAAVADHGDDAALLVLDAHRRGHAGGGGDRGRGVADAEGVVLALGAVAERREAAEAADRLQALAAPGEHLVRIGLVTDVPDQAVVRRVEAAVQRDRQLDGTEIGGEVTADAAQRLDQIAAHFNGQRRQLGCRQPAQLVRGVDASEQRVSGDVGHGKSMRPAPFWCDQTRIIAEAAPDVAPRKSRPQRARRRIASV
jgi:hypothetical protein